MADVFTCVLCARRGTQRFVMVAPDSNDSQAGYRARCQDRKACRRRIDAAGSTAGPAVAESGDREGGVSGSVAALASQLESLREQVRQLRGLRGEMDDTTRVLGDLTDQVQMLAARPPRPVAPSWLDLPAEQVPDVFAELTAWMDAVWLRYSDVMLPDCWALHPDVVEELLWLMHAWRAAYTDPTASLAQAADWHDRYRPGGARRIRDYVRTCSLERHAEPAPPATAPLAGLWEPVTNWWATHRDEPAPTPSEQQYAAADARRGGGRR